MACKCNKEVDLKFKRVSHLALSPEYQTTGAAGFDIASAEDRVVHPGNTVLVLTGLAFEVPVGYEVQIRPRSGISLKTPLLIKNAPGTIDSDYRGEVGIIIHNMADPDVDGNRPYLIKVGDRIAQGILKPITRAALQEVNELGTTERGEDGFGSTGISGAYKHKAKVVNGNV